MASKTQQAYTSIRINPAKKPVSNHFSTRDPVPWSAGGFYLDERPSFTFDPLFHGGAYYVQEPSSMVIDHIFRQLELPHQVLALDLCGAPGGKSTLLASCLKNDDLLVTNEVIKSRYHILVENMIKWGYPNVLLTNHDPKDFQHLGPLFDLVLVDAPCSGEGLWRKDAQAEAQWSEEHVRHCSLRQKRILADILPALKPGGFILYATCTFNDQENIDNVRWMIDTLHLDCLPITLDEGWNFSPRNKGNAIGYQADPAQTRGEGFFFSLLRKNNAEKNSSSMKKRSSGKRNLEVIREPGETHSFLKSPESFSYGLMHGRTIFAYPASIRQHILKISSLLPKSRPALELGLLKKGTLVPAHALAMSSTLSKHVPYVDLDREAAIRYLQRSEQIQIQHNSVRGWLLARYQGIPIGWLKNLGKRVKNHYPMRWRIRKQST